MHYPTTIDTTPSLGTLSLKAQRRKMYIGSGSISHHGVGREIGMWYSWLRESSLGQPIRVLGMKILTYSGGMLCAAFAVPFYLIKSTENRGLDFCFTT